MMERLDIIQIPVLQDNYVYLIHDPVSTHTAVVDPAESLPVLKELEERGWTLSHILNTHHHMDHVGANLELKKATNCLVVGAACDAKRIPGIDIEVDDGDHFIFGTLIADIMFVPGHTTGHICYYFTEAEALFVGDTLFAMGCGRLFEGTAEQMWRSLARLRSLPGNTMVYCAHEYTEANGKFALSVEPHNHALQQRMNRVRILRAEGKPTVPFSISDERATNPFMRPESRPLQEKVGLVGQPPVDVFREVRRLKDHF